MPLNQMGLFFIEDQFFLKQKKAFVPLSDPAVQVADGAVALSSSWMFSAGISFGF